jgi:hypothetical protein
MFRDDVLQSNARVACLIDGRELKRRFDAHRNGQTDQSYALWAVWVLERWLRTFTRPPAAASLKVG